MFRLDLAIYVVHALSWGAFYVARTIIGQRGGAPGEAAIAPVAERQEIAPFSRMLLGFHMLGFGLLYFGLGQAVIPGRVPDWFWGQRIAGGLLIPCGPALMIWALVYFRSWRFRAKLDAGHELATGGPFRFVRHPIYAGMNVLALGTAIWVPTAIVWSGFALTVLGSDLRGRAEEKLLTNSFGDVYRSYCARTRRFIPGIY